MQPARFHPFSVRTALLGTAAFAGVVLTLGSFYTVQPTEMAGVRRFGVVTSPAPIGPGLHWKLPVVDRVDHLQVSLTSFRTDDLQVYTIDNQSVRIGVGLSYRVPAGAVFRLLYAVGGVGDVDIQGSLRPIVADRALRVFARRNTISISAEREAIATEIRRSVQDSINDTFGIELVDLQLSRIEYSPAFTQSVEAAVRAKNDALQAENTVARIRFEGEQTKVQAAAQAEAASTRADGEARALVIRARADSQAAVLRADGEAQALAVLAEAQARAVQQLGQSVGANPSVVGYETVRRWDGKLPATMLPGATLPLLALPGATASR